MSFHPTIALLGSFFGRHLSGKNKDIRVLTSRNLCHDLVNDYPDFRLFYDK
jgi:hypothetical protein